MFQHHDEPKHSAKTTEFLKIQNEQVHNQSSMLPDLNPVEHLWNIFKQKIEQQQPYNNTELEKCVMSERKILSMTVQIL